MRVQDKIMDAIRKIASDAGLESVESWSFANVGRVHFQRPHSFDPLFFVAVDFQSDHLTGGIVYPGESLVSGGPHRNLRGGYVEPIRERCFFLTRYNGPGEVQRFLDAVKLHASKFATNEEKTPYYLLTVIGDVEPELAGPFSTEDERDAAARAHKAENGDKDGIFWLDAHSLLDLRVGFYSGGFFKEGEPT
jgi:hypothetical protein